MLKGEWGNAPSPLPKGLKCKLEKNQRGIFAFSGFLLASVFASLVDFAAPFGDKIFSPSEERMASFCYGEVVSDFQAPRQ